MEPVGIAIAIVIGIVVVALIVIVLVSRRSNASNFSEMANPPAPARPSNIPASVRRKGRDFVVRYDTRHGSWGFFLGDDWIIYEMLMDGAYLGLFYEAYPDVPFLDADQFVEPVVYAPEPESAIETPEPVAPIETELHEPVSESPPVRETFSESTAPKPSPSPDPPQTFGDSDFGSSDFGSSDFGGGDD